MGLGRKGGGGGIIRRAPFSYIGARPSGIVLGVLIHSSSPHTLRFVLICSHSHASSHLITFALPFLPQLIKKKGNSRVDTAGNTLENRRAEIEITITEQYYRCPRNYSFKFRSVFI